MAYCLCRPPGHHVLPTRPMGFGMVNFISVAAEHLLSQYAGHISKVRMWHVLQRVCFELWP